MLFNVGVCWEEARGGQTKTGDQATETLKIGLSHVNRFRLPDWGPHDYRNQ